MTWGTVAVTEALWSLGALAGLAIILWAYHDARCDLAHLRRRGLNGARERVARGNVRDESMRVAIMLVFLSIGMVAMGQPSANPDTPVTALAWVISGGLMLCEGLLVAKAIANRRDRIWIIRYLAEQEEAA